MNYPITTERAELFNHNILIGMKIVVDGYASVEQMTAAFKKAVSMHEILNTKIKIESDGSAYYVPGDGESNSIEFSGYYSKLVIYEQERKRFRVEDGEFLRVFIKPKTEGFRALFLMHHLAGDGKSLLFFIETFLKALNNEKIEFKPLSLLTPDKLQRKHSFIGKLYLNYSNRMWDKVNKVFTFEDLENSYENFWKTHETEIIKYTYPADKVIEEMKNYSKDGVHFSAWALTKFLKKQKIVQKIGIAIDIRPEDHRAMGNRASAIVLKTKYNEEMTFRENAVKVQKKINKKKNKPNYKYSYFHFVCSLRPTLVDALNMQRAGGYDNPVSRRIIRLLGFGKRQDFSLANLCKVDLRDNYGPYKIDDFMFIPPVISYGKNVVGIATWKNQIQVIIHKYKD